MGLVQCFVIVLTLSAHLVLTFPSMDYVNGCKLCKAGEYQKSCTECAPCPAGSYTSEPNQEDSCHDCYRDCRPDFHLKVVEKCTSTSDIKCDCEAGFTCSAMVSYSTQCKECKKKIQETTTTESTPNVSGKDKHLHSLTSSEHSSTTAKPCRHANCVTPPTRNDTHFETVKTNSHLAAILCPLVVIGCLALVILFFVRRPGDESCFKQAVALLVCSGGGRDASKPKEATHQFPRDSFSAKHQPSSLSAANLGPVHVHNPGTVIFGWLSHVTGQVATTIDGGTMAERRCGGEEDERNCPVFHPTSSPSIHLSEEERSREIDSIFFPSQEEGKDCHISKEEAL